jgi:anti-anti-sigma factor
MTRTVADLHPVSHACIAPTSDEQLWEITAEWLACGLEAGERVLFFEDGTAESVLERLADDRVPTAQSLADGQLTIVPGEQTRAALQAPAEQLAEVAAAQLDEEARRGWPAVRVTGNIHSKLAGGLDDIVEYEHRIDGVYRLRPWAHMLCVYDHRHFPPDAARTLLTLHHTVVARPALYDDALLRITSSGPGSLRVAGEVDHSNRTAISRLLESALDQALRSHTAPTDITLDLHSLRFLDVGGAVGLMRAAEEFPQSHRLVLSGVRPRVLRVLERCGAPFATGLVVEPRPAEIRTRPSGRAQEEPR